jgi:hypothetical protein
MENSYTPLSEAIKESPKKGFTTDCYLCDTGVGHKH